jgi:hypothetical protein
MRRSKKGRTDKASLRTDRQSEKGPYTNASLRRFAKIFFCRELILEKYLNALRLNENTFLRVLVGKKIFLNANLQRCAFGIWPLFLFRGRLYYAVLHGLLVLRHAL